MYSSSWWIVVEIASRINEALSSAVSDISGVSLVCCLRIYARRTATPSFRPMIFRLARSGPEHGLGWGGCRPLPPSRVEPLLMSKHLSITSHPMVDAITSFNGGLDRVDNLSNGPRPPCRRGSCRNVWVGRLCARTLGSRTYLTSPECVLSFPRTWRRTPGFPSTLQKGIRTAASSVSDAALWALWAFSDWEHEQSSASRMMAHERRLRGSVRETSGFEEALGTTEDINVRSIPLCPPSTSPDRRHSAISLRPDRHHCARARSRPRRPCPRDERLPHSHPAQPFYLSLRPLLVLRLHILQAQAGFQHLHRSLCHPATLCPILALPASTISPTSLSDPEKHAIGLQLAFREREAGRAKSI